MPGEAAIGQIAEAGVKVAQAGVESVEKVSKALPAVAEAPKVIGAVEQGMIKTIDAAGGAKAVNPDAPIQALAKFIPEPPAIPKTSGLENVAPTQAAQSLTSVEASLSPVKPQTDIAPREPQGGAPPDNIIDAKWREVPTDKALDTVVPGDVAIPSEKQLAPIEDDLVPIDEPIDAEWRELPGGRGELPPKPGGQGEIITTKIHDLIGKGSEKWGQGARRQFIDAFSSLHSEQVLKKVNVIHGALAVDSKLPFERVLSSILYSLTPEQADAYLATVSEILSDENEETVANTTENDANITDAEFSVLPDEQAAKIGEQKVSAPLRAEPTLPTPPRVDAIKGAPSLKAIGGGSAMPSSIDGILSSAKSAAEKIPIPVKR